MEQTKQEILAIAIGLAVIIVFFFTSGFLSFNSGGIFGLSIGSTSNGSDNGAREELGVERELFDGRVVIIDTLFGSGDSVELGSVVTLHYIGGFEDGEIFDSSYERNEPISFISGAGMVIPGIDGGIQGMKEGGKRTIVIAPEFGYGEQEVGPIPPDSILVFDVEIVDVEYQDGE